MKRLLIFFTVIGLFTLGVPNNVMAQEDVETTTEQEAAETASPAASDAEELSGLSAMHQELKIKFIEGGVEGMGLILVLLIFGLALAIERIIYLNLSGTNTEKLLGDLENALNTKGVEAAIEVCRNTRGPVASIFYQGLSRMDDGLEAVEKSLVSYGGIQTALLEKGLTWIALLISIAPMVGFLFTIVGMVIAFDDIERAGDMSPSIVAGGIKVALLTTLLALIVAITLQTFYNYLLSKIDAIVSEMENSSITFIDMIVKFDQKK